MTTNPIQAELDTAREALTTAESKLKEGDLGGALRALHNLRIVTDALMTDVKLVIESFTDNRR